MWDDTIAALSTPWGDGGIAVLRLSGPRAWEIAVRCVELDHPPLRNRFAKNGRLIDLSGESIDHCLVLPFRGPKSFTGEDVAEIHCHGGSLLAARALEIALAQGARMAEPGEFTRRAYENGRMDLSQAEAVAALIQAKSIEALKAADRALSGQLNAELAVLAQEVLELCSQIEVGLDFPEEDVPWISDEEFANRVGALRLDLADLRDRCSSGMVLREGVKVALLGRPNAGKSSLLNTLLKEARSIVTSIPGTTRDVVEVVLTHRGVPLRLLDTAGIGEAPHDEVEELGARRSRQAMEDADLLLWLVDSSRPLDDLDRQLIEDVISRPHLLVLSKCDLPTALSAEELNESYPQSSIVAVSSASGLGVDELKEAVVGQMYGNQTLNQGLNASAHQLELLRHADEMLGQSLKALEGGLGQSTAVDCLAEVRADFDRLLGIGSTEEMLHHIFSQFCLGK